MVLDTETTGFGISDVVVQMAFAVFDADGRMLSSYNRIWSLPPRVTISRRAFKVHKISYGRVRREGLEAAEQMRAVQSVLAQLQERGLPIVAHNAVFDARLLRQTAVAHGLVGDGEWPLARERLVLHDEALAQNPQLAGQGQPEGTPSRPATRSCTGTCTSGAPGTRWARCTTRSTTAS